MGTESLGNPKGSNNIRPGRCPGKDALLPSKSSRHCFCILGLDRKDLVDFARFPEGRYEADPNDFDLVGTGWTTQEDGRLSGLDRSHMKLRFVFSQGLCHSMNRVRGAHHLDERVDAAICLSPDFIPKGVVTRYCVMVVQLVCPPVAGSFADSLGSFNHPFD